MSRNAGNARVLEEHIAEGRAPPGAPVDDGRQHPLVVYSSKSAPTDAMVKVHHRDRWFWIDDRDLRSKGMFALLQILTKLAESPDAAQTPLLTIPAG